MSLAHPPQKPVPLSSGKTVMLRPWTMAQRDELKPRLAELLDNIVAKDLIGGGAQGIELGKVFMELEDEVCVITRGSIPLEVLSEEEWAAMAWEDLPKLAQGVWELNVARSEGLLGKMGAGLGDILAKALAAAGNQAGSSSATPNPSTPPKPNGSRPSASATSPDGGAPTQNG